MSKVHDREFPVKLVGSASWVVGPEPSLDSPIRRGFLRSPLEVVLDCNVEGNQYPVVLHSSDGSHFDGSFIGRADGQPAPVRAEGKLYAVANLERCCLIGDWYEDNCRYRWWAEVRAVEAFADESD